MFRCKYLQELNKKVIRTKLGYQEKLSLGCMFRCKYLQELSKKVFRSESGYQEELSVGCLGASTCRS